MSNMLNDNELDSLFRDSIESAEAQPSEQFWNKAYEGILARENGSYLARIKAWKRATIALACIVVGLICYSVYITEKVNNLDNQIAQVEKFQANTSAQNAANTTSNSNVAINGNNSNASNKEGASNNNQSSTASVNEVNSLNSVSANKNSQVKSTVANQNESIAANQAKSSNAGSLNSKTEFASASNNHKNRGNHNVVASNQENVSEHNMITMLGSNKTTVKSNTEEADVNGNDNQTISNIIYPAESSNDSPDSAVSEPVIAKSHQPSKFQRYVLPHVSASVFASYNMADPVMNGYSSADNLSASQLNSREHQTVAYSFGAKVGYDIATKWTIQAGISYQVYQFSIAPSTLSPQKVGAESNYQLVTSSGNVYLPFIANSNANATVSANGNALRSYINIPVQAKYNLVNRHKLKIYGTFGAAIGILEYNQANIQAANSMGSENINVKSMDGTSQVTGSYLVGIGAEYKMGKAISVYAEPSYLGAITPVNNTSLIKVSNNMVNFAGGLIYHF